MIFFVSGSRGGGRFARGLRWHPPFVSVLHSSPFGFGLCVGIRELLACFTRRRLVLVFALASANC
ncbi:hypothetical protein BCAR13_2000001 [Paraburkholderia caribensis]|nr:hypothetical protein BCAR13_2000001 [Paraburkholderia caribensis]